MGDGRRHWIADPEGHRRLWNDTHAPMDGQVDDDGAVHMVMTVPPEDWVCDFCNGSIPTRTDDDHPTLIPVDGESALCAECAQRHGYVPGDPRSWSTRVCGCDACLAALPPSAPTLALGPRLPERQEVPE